MVHRSLVLSLLLASSGCVCVRHDPDDVEPLRVRRVTSGEDWSRAQVCFRAFRHNRGMLKEDPTGRLLGQAARVTATVASSAVPGAQAARLASAAAVAANDGQDERASDWLLAHPLETDEVPDWVASAAQESLPFASLTRDPTQPVSYALEGRMIHHTGLSWYTYAQFGLTLGASLLFFPSTGRDFTVDFELKLVDLASRRTVRAWRARRRYRRTGYFLWFLVYGDEALGEDRCSYQTWLRTLLARIGQDLRQE